MEGENSTSGPQPYQPYEAEVTNSPISNILAENIHLSSFSKSLRRLPNRISREKRRKANIRQPQIKLQRARIIHHTDHTEADLSVAQLLHQDQVSWVWLCGATRPDEQVAP